MEHLGRDQCTPINPKGYRLAETLEYKSEGDARKFNGKIDTMKGAGSKPGVDFITHFNDAQGTVQIWLKDNLDADTATVVDSSN